MSRACYEVATVDLGEDMYTFARYFTTSLTWLIPRASHPPNVTSITSVKFRSAHMSIVLCSLRRGSDE
jgi:hypothetical protein